MFDVMSFKGVKPSGQLWHVDTIVLIVFFLRKDRDCCSLQVSFEGVYIHIEVHVVPYPMLT